MPADSSTRSSRQRRSTIRVASLVTVWYLSSSVAVILTKALFSGSHGRLPAFAFALTVTATNNIVAWTAATLALGPLADHLQMRTVQRLSLVIGTTTAAEIGLSNVALSLLSVSYATVLKGMAPLFVMAWGALLGVHRLQPGLVLSMAAIVVGVGLAVAGEAGTRPSLRGVVGVGFIAQMVSGLLGGFRWVLMQVFVKGVTTGADGVCAFFSMQPLSRALSGVETIRATAPITLMALVPVVVLWEGRALCAWLLAASVMEMVNLVTLLTVIGMCVYMLLWAEYELVKVTSSLTVSVGLVMKEILLIFAGRLIFHEKLSWLTCFGFYVAQMGILKYAWLRRTIVTEVVIGEDVPADSRRD